MKPIAQYSTEILVALSASLCVLSNGIHIGWTAQAVDILTTGKGPILITDDESAVLASCALAGAILGGFAAYTMVHFWSQSKSIFLASVPSACAFLIFAFIPNLYAYYFARFIVGLGGAIAMSVCTVYGIEIASPEIRGIIGIVMTIAGHGGTFMAYALMPYIDFKLINALFTLVPITQFIVCLFIPESPYLLLKKKDTETARKVLVRLRKTPQIEKELTDMTNYVNAQYANPITIKMFFTEKVYRKAMLFALILLLSQQSTGLQAIMSFSQKIFAAGSDWVSAEVSGMIFSFLGMVIPFITGAFIDKAGRKMLLLISACVMSLSLTILGAFFYFQSNEYEGIDNWGWLPLVCMASYLFGFGLGLGSVVMLYLSEIMPTNVRILGSCIMITASNGAGILVAMSFNFLKSNFGEAAPMWVYACCTIISSAVILVFLPETKGKSFEEIQHILEHGKSKPSKILS